LNPAVKFGDIASATRPWLLVASCAQLLLLSGNLMLLVNFLQSLCGKPTEPAANLFRTPSKMEATAS
jgi:hypothetical protein